ncbi:MAG TPA: hypothetical protein VF498_08980 [Anaerolineales bacterium]
MLSTQENVFIYNQVLGCHDPGYRARRQAAQLFWRVYSEGQRRRLWNILAHGDNNLRDLDAALQGKPVKSRHAAGLQNVTIARIRGSEGRSKDFDAGFHPIHSRTQERWVSIATAQKLDVALPPVELIQVGDDYYVRDGHHRISVAKSLGQMVIEAEVTVWEV